MRNVKIAATVAAAIFLTACATDDPNRRGKAGAAIGAVAGAVLGHQIHDKNGRYAGAAIGALTGAAVGNYMDKQQRQLQQDLAAETRNNDIRVVRIDDETLKLEVNSEVTFDVNSASIKSGFRNSLTKVAAVINEYDKTAVHVIGHTDSQGSGSYNQKLSERRAGSVGSHLSSGGIARDRMRMAGRGETAPIADNSTSYGRQRNRRVEIYLKPIVKFLNRLLEKAGTTFVVPAFLLTVATPTR